MICARFGHGKENGRETCNVSPRVSALQAPAHSMDKQHRAIRAKLSSMAPRRAVAYIRSFELPPDEMACLVECDVRGRSCVQVAQMLHLSVDGLAKLRRKAYRKIADGQNESTD